jgi:hypothetical protein
MNLKIFQSCALIPRIIYQKKVNYNKNFKGFYTTIIGVMDNNHAIRLIGVALHTKLDEN